MCVWMSSSTAEHILRMASEILRVRYTILIEWLGSIKKGNRKSEILLRDAEVRTAALGIVA